MYLGELLPELSHSLGEPGQDLQGVSHWTLNDTLKDTILTSGYAEGLGNAPMVGGSRAGCESVVQDATKPQK